MSDEGFPRLTRADLRHAVAWAMAQPVPGPARAAATVALAVGGWLASLALAAAGPWWLLLAGPLLAVSLTMLAVVVHECAHRSLFGAKVDTALGLFAGLLAFQPFLSFRRGHGAHHTWVGGAPGRDPTPSPRGPAAPNRLLDLALRLRVPVFYWGGVYLPYLFYDLRPTAGPRRAAHVARHLLDLALIAALHVALARGLGTPTWLVWAGVGFVGAGILYEDLFTLSQHVGLAPDAARDRHSTLAQVGFARSARIPLPALFFHFNLHKEHHLLPRLNYQRLPHLHAALKARRPDLYAFTDDAPGWVRRRRYRSGALLSARAGDAGR